jgi:hypothetical protein
MPLDNEAKTIVHNLLDKFEKLWTENIALKTVLEGVQLPGFQEEWQALFVKLRGDPETTRTSREIFAPLYDRISRAMDEATALEVLKSVPSPKGRVH